MAEVDVTRTLVASPQLKVFFVVMVAVVALVVISRRIIGKLYGVKGAGASSQMLVSSSQTRAYIGVVSVIYGVTNTKFSLEEDKILELGSSLLLNITYDLLVKPLPVMEMIEYELVGPQDGPKCVMLGREAERIPSGNRNIKIRKITGGLILNLC